MIESHPTVVENVLKGIFVLAIYNESYHLILSQTICDSIFSYVGCMRKFMVTIESQPLEVNSEST